MRPDRAPVLAALSALATLALAAAIAPGQAHADLMIPPPPPLEVTGVERAHDGAGPPSVAAWRLANRGGSAMHVRVASVICLLEGMRLPVHVVGVRVDGREVAGREIDLAAGASVTLEVRLDGFSTSAERAGRWSLELAADVSGSERPGRVTGTTTVRRAARAAAR